jgi:hypothetical protein
MPLFNIETTSTPTLVKRYQVEAATKEEAEKRFKEGSGTLFDVYDKGEDDHEKITDCQEASFQEMPW